MVHEHKIALGDLGFAAMLAGEYFLIVLSGWGSYQQMDSGTQPDQSHEGYAAISKRNLSLVI